TGTPARIGGSLVKAGGKAGRITAKMAGWFTRSLREAVDWTKLSSAMRAASLTEPAVAARAAREAVKVEKTEALMRAIGDVGKVQGKAGTKAALDALKIAEGPRDLSRMARLAEAKGTRTRAILKTLGRGAILLTANAFTLFSWLFTAAVAGLGVFSPGQPPDQPPPPRFFQRPPTRPPPQGPPPPPPAPPAP